MQSADNQSVSNFMYFEKYLQLYIMGHMISYFPDKKIIFRKIFLRKIKKITQETVFITLFC